MSRICCSRCQRPKVTCVCRFTSAIHNECLVIFLLHPKEINQAKGTLPLLVNSLSNSKVIVGENFSDNAELNNLLAKYGKSAALLYPSENAETLPLLSALPLLPTLQTPSVLSAQAKDEINIVPVVLCRCLILLDATWKKAYRMYQLSVNLHSIKHFSLPPSLIGQYDVRKTKKKNALSTLEACCYALSIIEIENTTLAKETEDLLTKFVEFNQFQLSFRPKQQRLKK